MPPMHIVAAVVTALYGLVSLTGGVMGYLKGSVISLVAGGTAGVLLLLCAVGISKFPVPSLIVAIVLALLLVARFAVSLFNKGGELTSVLFAISIVMVVGGVIVAACAALALLNKS